MTDIKEHINLALESFVFEPWCVETQTQIHNAIQTVVESHNLKLELITSKFDENTNSAFIDFTADGRKFTVSIQPTPVNFEEVLND